MITLLESQQAERVGTLILRPNQSLTWTATLVFLGALSTISLTIAVGFLLNGLWMILPFTLLELTVVSACFYLLLRRAQQQQVIEFFVDAVQVSCGRTQPESTHVWQRYFTKIFVNPPRHMWYAPTILLKHRQESIELGPFLNTQEKLELIAHLRHLVDLADQRQVSPT